MLKEIVGFLLQASPFWSLGVNILIAWIASREAVENRPPVKTIVAVSSFVATLGLLVVVHMLA